MSVTHIDYRTMELYMLAKIYNIHPGMLQSRYGQRRARRRGRVRDAYMAMKTGNIAWTLVRTHSAETRKAYESLARTLKYVTLD